MFDSGNAIKVTHNSSLRRYEVSIAGRLAGVALYQAEPQFLVLTHTQIFAPFQERGIDDLLAQDVLDDVRRRKLMIEPICPFIAGFIRDNPEYLDLVPAVSLPLLHAS